MECAAVGGRARSVAPACVALYLAVALGLLLAILHRDDGVFTYTLDDPYIHLALAESLAHGHYGINLGEASSPSSSILWPFLLTPFAGRAWDQYVPLVLNVVFCGMAAWLIGQIADGWGWHGRGRPAGRASAGSAGRLEWLGRFALASALMLVANLAGLTFVGMEHGLQVLLAVACAAGMVDAFAGQPIPAWCLAAAALGPMVRYENFALVAALAVVLWGQERGRTAARLAGASLVGPLLFSWFLVSRGLPALPSSVLVKGSLYAAPGRGFFDALKAWNDQRFLGNVGIDLAPQMALTALLVYFAVMEKRRMPRFVLGGAALAEVLQVAIGRYGWFHRYEVYALIFGGIVVATLLVESKRLYPALLTIGLIALGSANLAALLQTPAAASNVYQQQYQMHRFVAEFYKRNVAVNDLGWVSYRRPAGVYVLDLVGLASPEVARRAVKDEAWLDAITREHGAGVAMVYPDWLAGIPDDWEPLAKMCVTGPRISAAWPCMVFYSTGVGDHALLTADMAAFARTLPASVKMTLGKDSTDEDE